MTISNGDGWVPALAQEDLPERRTRRVSVDGLDVLLYRDGERIHAVSNRCSHQGAPLHKGVVKAAGPAPSVTCPLHGSMFLLSDGRVLHGPALEPLPVYETRMHDGWVEVRTGQAG